jgi:hypothetical protein
MPGKPKLASEGLRKGNCIMFFVGAGTACLVVGLLGSVAYNSMWDDDNKWYAYQYGLSGFVHRLTLSLIAMAVCALLSFLFAFWVRSKPAKLRPLEIGLWIAYFVFAFVTVVLQGVSIGVTAFGDAEVSPSRDYTDDSDFTTYLKRYGTDEWKRYMTEAVPAWFNAESRARFPNRSMLHANVTFDLATDLIFSAYIIPYVIKDRESGRREVGKVLSCAVNWSAVLNRVASDPASMTFMVLDPCFYEFEEDDAAECIGSWTLPILQRYWCALFRSNMSYTDWLSKGRSLEDRDQYHARENLTAQMVDSLSAFYLHNLYFLCINVVSFVFAAIAVPLDLKWRNDSKPKKEDDNPKV